MISRHWKGLARDQSTETYIEHLQNDTFPKLSRIKGFIRASILLRKVERGTEFLIVTDWESIEAIRSFAGEPADTAVVPPVVREMMIEYERQAVHYQVAAEYRGR